MYASYKNLNTLPIIRRQRPIVQFANPPALFSVYQCEMKAGKAFFKQVLPLATILLAILLVPHKSEAQTPDIDGSIPTTWLRGAELRLGNPDIAGTPFLFKEWLPGSMRMTNGRLVEDIKVNFVNQAGEVMISKPYAGLEVKYGVIELDVVSVTILDNDGDRNFVRYWADTIESSGSELHYFYEVLAAGKVSLLKKPFKLYKRARLREAYSNGNNQAKYVLKNEYYLRLPGQKGYTTLHLTKGNIFKILGKDLAAKAKQLMKAQKGKWSSEKDVANVLEALFK